jgi:hypothetical protein
MLKKDYDYLANTLYNLYFFYKWFDKFFLFNKGSIHCFHKDPTVTFIGHDINADVYIFNNGHDFDNLKYFYFTSFYFMIPFILYLHFILLFLLEFNSAYDEVLYLYQKEFTFWFTWFLVQFEFLQSNIIQLLFSMLSNFSTEKMEWLLEFVDTDDSIFSNNKSNKIFPLYKYFIIKYFAYEESNLLETFNTYDLYTSSSSIQFFHYNAFLYIWENLYIIYDIFFIKFIKFDTYSYFILFYNLFRFILFLLFLLYIIFNNNKLFKFFNYIKINFNNLNFSNNIINNYLKKKYKSK